jgi:hypothetical protein
MLLEYRNTRLPILIHYFPWIRSLKFAGQFFCKCSFPALQRNTRLPIRKYRGLTIAQHHYLRQIYIKDRVTYFQFHKTRKLNEKSFDIFVTD